MSWAQAAAGKRVEALCLCLCLEGSVALYGDAACGGGVSANVVFDIGVRSVSGGMREEGNCLYGGGAGGRSLEGDVVRKWSVFQGWGTRVEVRSMRGSHGKWAGSSASLRCDCCVVDLLAGLYRASS